MPVRRLPSNPNLDHLRYQAKDLLKENAAGDPGAAQRIREFHPRFTRATDAEIFAAHLKLSDAQLTIARESGFQSWARLKRHIEKPTLGDQLNLPHHERIEDPVFRRAVDLIDAGDVAGLRGYLRQHPKLVHQRVVFEGWNYFHNPTLLEFVAGNPVRHARLPKNIVEVAKVILDSGAEKSALNETLMLVATGSVPRECGVQLPLIDLLCDHGADPNGALHAAILHGELEAAHASISRLQPLWDASRISASCFPAPAKTTAIWRSPSRRSLARLKSFACCWTRAKIRTATTRSAAIRIRRRCTRLPPTATRKWCGCSSSAAQDWT